MSQELSALERGSQVLDGDRRTMHIRCGHDIQNTLREAGFLGYFNLHINPYCQGPVPNVPDFLELRARYIVESAVLYS